MCHFILATLAMLHRCHQHHLMIRIPLAELGHVSMSDFLALLLVAGHITSRESDAADLDGTCTEGERDDTA